MVGKEHSTMKTTKGGSLSLSMRAFLHFLAVDTFTLAYLTRMEPDMTSSPLPGRRYQRRVVCCLYTKVTRPPTFLERRITNPST